VQCGKLGRARPLQARLAKQVFLLTIAER